MELPKGIYARTENKKDETTESEVKKNVEKTEDVKDNIKVASNVRKKNGNSVPKITSFGWFIMMVLFTIPFVNITECVVLIIGKKYKEGKRWAKGAIIVAIIMSILFLLIWTRLHNMTYSEMVKVFNFFNK